MKRLIKRAAMSSITFAHKYSVTPIKLAMNSAKSNRRLEIGPGLTRIPGFETVNVVGGRHVDYIADGRSLPFKDGSFEVVYASHILEHIPWYQTLDAIKEWVRVLAPNGRLEIWVPDGLKIAQSFVQAEESDGAVFHNDGWWRFNEEQDPCKWMSGRCFSYGDGTGVADDPNWHRALFSERYLRTVLEQADLTQIAKLDQIKIRGYDHGWINLGVTGVKL